MPLPWSVFGEDLGCECFFDGLGLFGQVVVVEPDDEEKNH
jgi:hypothetical protein